MEVTLYNWPLTLLFGLWVVSTLSSIWCIFDTQEVYWEDHEKWGMWVLCVLTTIFLIWAYFDPEFNWTKTIIIE